MKSYRLVYYVLALLPISMCQFVAVRAEEQLQDLYKKIADGLIGLRKEYPASQPKVYALLDQIDKLYKTAKSTEESCNSYKQKLNEKTTEASSLRHEIVTMKNDVLSTKKNLECAREDLGLKLEEEKNKAQQLMKEKQELLNKVAMLESRKKNAQKIVAAKKEAAESISREGFPPELIDHNQKMAAANNTK